MMHPAVIKVAAMDDYVLIVDFDNGEQGILNMKPFLDFGVFQRLKDPAVFKRVHVVFDTVGWDVGVDLDPEFVYTKCQLLNSQPEGLS